MTTRDSSTESISVAPNGMAARLFLAFLASAGLFYVNIMAALVSGLIEGLGFSSRHAGFVTSANVYGAACGALLAVLLVKRVPWRPTSYALLVMLIVLDGVSMMLRDPWALVALRFVHGFAGGLLVGVAYSVFARMEQPDRTFGMLLVVQWGLGGLGLWLLPPLVPVYGTWVLFAALIAFTATALAMLPFLDAYAVPDPARGSQRGRVELGPLVLTFAAMFLFQAANMGPSAYIIEIGKHFGLEQSFIGPTLLASSWTGILGATLVIVLGTRFGRLPPLCIGLVLTVLGTWALHFSASQAIFFVANAVVGAAWALVIAYFLGMCAQFDRAGQMAALGGFASKMGLASGPLAAAFILGTNDFARLINLSVLGLILSAVACLIPARLLDRRR